MRLTSDQDSHDKVCRYFVEDASSAGFAGYAGFAGGQFQSRKNNFRDREGANNKESARERYGADPASECWEAVI